MSEGHRYESATIGDHATAILGNKYGDTVNIQQATFILQATPTTQPDNDACEIVRHNRVLPGGQKTVESITTYNNGRHFLRRGTSQQIEIYWERCEDIGVGSYGEVHREQTEQNGQIKSRAVKVLRKRRLEHMQIDHKKELDALIDLSQPNFSHRFVEFYSWYESHDEIHLAMEYVPCGDLGSYLQAGLSESDTRQIACQVLDGIRIMHRLDLIHRDIKPANIFVVQREPFWWVKLGDFSICKRSTTRQTILRTQVGTQGYQAPEVLGLVETLKKDTYDSKCDIWSFGCLVFEMLTGQLPFPDIGTLNNYCNDEIQFPGLLIKDSGGTLLIAEFVWWMLQPNPIGRPTADQAMFLLSHRCESKAMLHEGSGGSDHLYLKDCVGRHFKLPWHYCATWIEMESTLRTLCSYVDRDGTGQQVSKGCYELKAKHGICLDSRNWDRTTAPGMCVSVSIRPEPFEKALSHTKPPDRLNLELKHQSESQCSPVDLKASDVDTENSSETRNESQSYKALLQDDTGIVLVPENHHRTPINSEEMHKGGQPSNNTVELGILDLKNPPLKGDRDSLVPMADHKTDAYSIPPEISERTPDRWANYEVSAMPTAPRKSDTFKIVKDRHISEGIQRSSYQMDKPNPDLNKSLPAPPNDTFRVVTIDLTKNTSASATSFDMRKCADKERTGNEALAKDEANLKVDPSVKAKGHVEHKLPARSGPHPSTGTMIKASQELTKLTPIERVRCKECLLSVRKGGFTCLSCRRSRREDRVIMLVDWRGDVYALLRIACVTWVRMRQLINECMIGDPWHPMVERGYFDLVDPHRKRCITEPDEWTSFFITSAYNTHSRTVLIDLWSKAWIFNLPPYLTVPQLTNEYHEESNTSGYANIEPDKSELNFWDGINFMDRDAKWLRISWRKARTWEHFDSYVKKWQVDQKCDLFILELKSPADALSWPRILPGMHVYEIVHPMSLFERGKQADRVARRMLRRLENCERSTRLSKHKSISGDRDDTQDDRPSELALRWMSRIHLPDGRTTGQPSSRSNSQPTSSTPYH